MPDQRFERESRGWDSVGWSRGWDSVGMEEGIRGACVISITRQFLYHLCWYQGHAMIPPLYIGNMNSRKCHSFSQLIPIHWFSFGT